MNRDFSWNIDWGNNLNTLLTGDYDKNIQNNKNLEKEVENTVSLTFELRSTIRNSKITTSLLKSKRKKSIANLSLNYLFDYDKKWFYNKEDKSDNHKFRNEFEASYTMSEQIIINGKILHELYESDDSFDSYSLLEVGVGFEILF